MIYQNEAEANEACHEWQSRLRLSDWKIKVAILPMSEIKADGVGECQGSNTMTIDRKESVIHLLDPKDWEPSRKSFPQDHEQTLVHELLHLYFEPLYHASPVYGKSDFYKHVEEEAICSLASSIVALKRGER